MTPELTILVPAYNEEENLAANLPLITAAARGLCERWEILVVDDGSTDQTAAVVSRARREEERIRLIRHPRNLGPGAAIPTALFWARGELVLLLPADLACDLAELPRFFAARTEADVVVGLRSDRRDTSLFRKGLSHLYIGALHALFGSRVRQYNYLQLWRRDIFARLPLSSRGVFVTAEIILRAERAGLRVVEVPLTYAPREHGQARGASWPSIARCAWELGRFRLRG